MRLLYGIGLAAALGIVLVSLLYAANYEDSTLSASLTVNIYVDTTIDKTSLSFGSLDPGTVNAPATENPVTLINTPNSNTPIDVYLNTTPMTSGANIMDCSYLSVKTTNTPSASDSFNCSLTYLNGTSANQGYIENLAVGSNVTLYFWHDVPFGQAAGSYTATVRIHSVADGNTP